MKEDMLPFALKATDMFRKVADGLLLYDKRNKQYYGLLNAALADVVQWLKELPRVFDEETSPRQIFRLLIILENLVQWPDKRGKHFKSLDPIVFQQEWFPGLSESIQYPGKGKALLRVFVISPNASKARPKLIESLEKFTKTESPVEPPKLADVVQAKHQTSAQDNYQYHLAELHRVLAMNCICQRGADEMAIRVNLRLRGFERDEKTPEDVTFGVFFFDHPHEQHGSEILSKEDFCDMISHRQQAQLRLVAQSDDLAVREYAPLSQFFCPHTSSFKLSELLNDKLKRKQRLTIAYLVANAVWQFYDSTWMHKEWSKDTIHFMFERRGNTAKAIYVNEPFLSTRFDAAEPPSKDRMKFQYHPLPKILALGIMMLEIELGLDIEGHHQNRPEFYDVHDNLTVNANHIIAMEIFKTSDLWGERETFEPFKELIGACLTADPFRSMAENPGLIRDAIYKHVVAPLKGLYEAAWGDFEKSDVRPIRVQPEGAEIPLIAGFQRLATGADDRVRSATMPLPKGSVSEASSAPTSDRWFAQLENLKTVLRLPPSKRDASYAPTRIAILDTGIDKSHSSSVVEYRDFLDPKNIHHCDNTGHGSNAFKLLQKVYPEAQIFVGRVWKSNAANDDTGSIMTKAIHHARETWKVDIIIMPSGFESEDEDMLRAIEEANAARVLLFAAASNHGNLTNIAFPARLYRAEKTFCMFSTDANARSLPAFNPSPLPGARNSFAILGEGITLGGDPPLSGTSFSTVIGAALAGRIIDFSRHHDTRSQIRRSEHLKRVEGMASVFAKMARMDNGYRCIAPWRLLPQMDYEDLLDMANRSEVRRRLCEVISGALEEVYG
ncbi:extracellular alkaline serine protease [Colletotrichum salicis]|uniref:Extracellular alkaline serine protease n=1 Tax=Colletotrichum salicis TaxID=1209931 RepID=A0A135V3U5_9PEZI|nr:extracellular alkaline serine protease [Colletotrichum salicis]